MIFRRALPAPTPARAVLMLACLSLICLMLAGPQALGRLALLGGLPGVAARLLDDPAQRGVALYRAGDYAGADAAFAQAGRTQTYNRGLSLAAIGDDLLAMAYFDAVLFANPADAEARRNRDLVAAMVPPETGDSLVPGRIAGAGGLSAPGDASDTTSAGMLAIHWKREVDARGIAASDDWLATISDDPGAFLTLRLRAEYDRRAAMGLIRPAEGDPW